jgi:pyruvate dehydrogenase E1 component beta subunit
LATTGVEIEIIDLRTAKPLDTETVISSVKKTNRLVVAHEAVKVCGLGAEIAATVAEEALDHLDGPIGRVGARDVPVAYNDNEEARILPQAVEIEQKIRAFF